MEHLEKISFRSITNGNKFYFCNILKICYFLGLENLEQYIGHTFRRGASSLLAKSNISKINLKRLGRWKSDSVAQRYIDESKANKQNISETISVSPSSEQTTTANNISCNSISIFNFNFNGQSPLQNAQIPCSVVYSHGTLQNTNK